jgi:peptidoglycan/xylan/chitin deacetylase (PgdA/CDA1 family)
MPLMPNPARPPVVLSLSWSLLGRGSLRAVAPVALALLAAGAGCAPPEAEPGRTTVGQAVTAAPGTYEIDFTEQPDYLPKNTMVLTFDDGPDEMYTVKVLDILKEKNVKATFFINTDNAINVEDNVAPQLAIRRIVDEGHELGSHSVHHPALALLKPAELEEELAGVERTVCRILGARAPRLTLFRAPFGDPYLGPLHGVGYDTIAPIVAKHAVHIGWAIDSNDWRFPDAPDAVFDSVSGLLKTAGQGSWGVMLMHSINPQTVAALPKIIDYIRSHGFVFKTSEDVVRARFGKSSGELIPGTNPCTGPGIIGAAHDDAGTPLDPSKDPSAPIADASAPNPGTSGTGGSAGPVDPDPSPGTGGAPAAGGSSGSNGGGNSASGGKSGSGGAGNPSSSGSSGSGGSPGQNINGTAGSPSSSSPSAPSTGCAYAPSSRKSTPLSLAPLALWVLFRRSRLPQKRRSS